MNQAPGAFAEEVHIPNADINAVPLPDSIDAEAAAGCGCRFMTSFHAMAHRAPVSAGDDVVIHGCGGIGLSAVHIANALGGNVIGVDLMDEKLDKAEELGAVDTVNAREVDDAAAEVHDITNGGADVSADALGIANHLPERGEQSPQRWHPRPDRADHLRRGGDGVAADRRNRRQGNRV